MVCIQQNVEKQCIGWSEKETKENPEPENLLNNRTSHGLVPIAMPSSPHAIVRSWPWPWHLFPSKAAITWNYSQREIKMQPLLRNQWVVYVSINGSLALQSSLFPSTLISQFTSTVLFIYFHVLHRKEEL